MLFWFPIFRVELENKDKLENKRLKLEVSSLTAMVDRLNASIKSKDEVHITFLWVPVGCDCTANNNNSV